MTPYFWLLFGGVVLALGGWFYAVKLFLDRVEDSCAASADRLSRESFTKVFTPRRTW